MSQSLLGSLSFDPPNPTVGDSVLVTVLDPSGKPLDADKSLLVAINGQPGSRHHVQFLSARQHVVRALATGPNGPESAQSILTVLPVEVMLSPGGSGPPPTIGWPEIGLPILQVGHMAMRPGLIGIAVGQRSQLDWTNRSQTALKKLPTMEVAPDGKPVRYRWSFGNGHIIDTMTPFAHYDFRSWMDPRQEHQHFDVSVTSADKTVTRTLTICNLYGKLKREAKRLHLPAEAANASVTKTGMTATAVIHNPEDQPISLAQRRFLPKAQHGQRTSASHLEDLHPPLEVPGKGSVSITLEPTRAQVPTGSTGFAAVFGGSAPGGEQVRCTVHVDVRAANWPHTTRPSVSAHSGQVTTGEPHDAATPSPDASRATDTMALVTHDLGPAAGPPSVQIGAVCNPDDLPDSLPPNVACQVVNPVQNSLVLMPARFMNAQKGDTVLAPGGVGLVGQLLTHVAIPQLYAHCGIMTDDFDQITHCTAEDDRYYAEAAYEVGSILGVPAPTDGFRPDIIKYGWPGAITQAVDDSVNGTMTADKGTPIPDPENPQDKYVFSDFNSSPTGAMIGLNWMVIPPMVVKPDPMLETDEHRARLHAVADQALDHVNHMHYRFFGYTDPTNQVPAPAEAKWATGTLPATCSSFIWLMFKKSGFQLQSVGNIALASDISPFAAIKGAKVASNTPDGLFYYTALERQNAASFFYGAITDLVKTTIVSKLPNLGASPLAVGAALGTIIAPGLGTVIGGLLGSLLGSNAEPIIDGLTKITSHVGNEFLNAFANDTVQTDDDNTTWQQTGDANSVSPDNIMFWNGPNSAARGPYGYCEPLLYREPRQEEVPVSHWIEFTQSGSLSGRVTFNAQPVAGASVQLYDLKSSATDVNGHYAIDGVPYGSYVAKATKTSGDMFLSNSPLVTVEAPQTTLNIALQLPLYNFRTVKLQGTLTTRYTFHVVLKVEDKEEPKQFYNEIELTPTARTSSPYSVNNTVKDASATVTITATMRDDGSIQCECGLQLHEVTQKKTIAIARDGSSSYQDHVSSKNDDAWISMTIENTLKQG